MLRLTWHVRDTGPFPQPGCGASGTATWKRGPYESTEAAALGHRDHSEPSPWAVSLPVRAARTENPEPWGSGR